MHSGDFPFLSFSFVPVSVMSLEDIDGLVSLRIVAVELNRSIIPIGQKFASLPSHGVHLNCFLQCSQNAFIISLGVPIFSDDVGVTFRNTRSHALISCPSSIETKLDSRMTDEDHLVYRPIYATTDTYSRRETYQPSILYSGHIATSKHKVFVLVARQATGWGGEQSEPSIKQTGYDRHQSGLEESMSFMI